MSKKQSNRDPEHINMVRGRLKGLSNNSNRPLSLQIRAVLMRSVITRIFANKMPDEEVVRTCYLTQEEVVLLMDGELGYFSLDTLHNVVRCLNMRVNLDAIKPI